MTRGLVLDIKRNSVSDGPGIRTAVFLKGCPLRCVWCHNPESQHIRPELSFIPGRCIGCGNCLRICPQKCHIMENGTHAILRENCSGCGQCAESCFPRALEIIGRHMSVGEVLDEVMEDRIFYEKSGGGLTLSGGEPMQQFAFTNELMHEASCRGIHTAMETCGFAPWKEYEQILPDVKLFLFDYKASDPELHKKLTGQDNRLIRDNLQHLSDAGAEIVLCCPLVPGLNDDESHLEQIAKWAERLPGIHRIALHPFHPLGMEKAQQIGRTYSPLKCEFTDKEQVARWKKQIAAGTGKPITA